MDTSKVFWDKLLALPSSFSWDRESEPFHSSYDNWHFYGTQALDGSDSDSAATCPSTPSSSPAGGLPDASGDEFFENNQLAPNNIRTTNLGVTNQSRKVVARVSQHVLRLEREYQLSRQILNQDPKNMKHFVTPVELIKIPSRNGEGVIAVSIFEAPGPNYLKELVQIGITTGAETLTNQAERLPEDKISLSQFLDFAIGAANCLEIVHHKIRTVHGEIRGDAFHFNRETGDVKMINFGSGPRSFENGLTTASWYSFTREAGVEQKIRYIAPEQTGRLPARPDGRTDIYSLGVLFWSILTGETPFAGETPLVIMQNVLSRRLPFVSSKRTDVPDTVSAVIAKMTQKNIDNRYNSVTGLKYDLQQIKHLVDEADTEGLTVFEIGTKDISSYFNLPTNLIGRKKEQEQVRRIIEKLSKAKLALAANGVVGSDSFSLQLASSTESKTGSVFLEEAASDVASLRSTDTTGSSIGRLSAPSKESRESKDADQESLIANGKNGVPVRRTQSLKESKADSKVDGVSTPSLAYTPSSAISVNSASIMLRQSGRKRRGQQCAAILITGAPGSGKSALLQMAQVTARQHGYYASAKFDATRKVPYESLLRVMSSLFRQIFSEPNLNTALHSHVRSFVGPVWAVLHTYLGLPLWLLDYEQDTGAPGTSTRNHSRRQSTSSSSSSSANQASEWLRGTSTKASRFMGLFSSVLQVVASMRFVALGFDDLQFADGESLDLLASIVTSNVPVLIIATARDDMFLASKHSAILAIATKVELPPFSEEETAEYVSATLHRESEYALPLVAVIQEKSGGNPFIVREMMETCFRKEAVYYSWSKSAWEYDLDKIFSEFASETYGSQISGDFVSKRMHELPRTARHLLAWASILGNTFHFSLVKTLMTSPDAKGLKVPLAGSKDPVSGLQSAISAYILIACGDEDRFRFAHDRYHHAAQSLLRDFDQKEMHFLIVRTLATQRADSPRRDANTIYMRSRHIVAAIDLIKERETVKGPYREMLYSAADNAMESGAKSAVIPPIEQAISLLDPTPWVDGDDSSYCETLKLYVKAAESHWHERNYKRAIEMVQIVYSNATSVMDMASCWIIEARVYAGRGDSLGAYECLLRALKAMGSPVQDDSIEACDAQLEQVLPYLQSLSARTDTTPADLIQSNMEALGIMLVEFIDSAFYCDEHKVYQAALLIIKTHMSGGVYAQCGIGYLHLAAMLMFRPGMLELAYQLADFSHELFEVYQDNSFTAGRGLTLHALFFGHIQYLPSYSVHQLLRASDASLTSGDRIASILNTGVAAALRIWIAQDLSDVEASIQDVIAELPDWEKDLRGGVLIFGARQFIKALQGKTKYHSAHEVLDEESKQSRSYKTNVINCSSLPEHQLFVYKTYLIMALVTFGHFERAVDKGRKAFKNATAWQSAKFVYDYHFYYSLAISASLRKADQVDDRKSMLGQINQSCQLIEDLCLASSNYVARVQLLKAVAADLNGDVSAAMVSFENAVDAAQANGFPLEEGLALEFYADFLIRLGSKRPAKRIIGDCLSVYRRINAPGKVKHLQTKYEAHLEVITTLASAEAGCQTDVIDTGNTSSRLQQNEEDTNRDLGSETVQDRTKAWIAPGDNGSLQNEFSAIGLDMIDLASILESSQLISSELNIDNLMGKMAEIITETATADLVGIVIKDEERNWALSAIGTPDGVQAYPDGLSLESDDVDRQLAQQVTTYVLRFREQVFVRNLLEDDRFSGVSLAYLEKNPLGKAMMALPIIRGSSDLLGAIYVEGPPNKFTERNMQVLRLLVNQISISLANAFDLKKVEKVSAENATMIEVQKAAVSRARKAEAEAIRNMRLKEEAANSKSLFLANVSHELRTPLNGVIGMSELLKSTSLTQAQSEYANSVQHCADTLLSLINDLLDFTKLDTGKMTMILKPVNLCSIVHEVVRVLSFTGKEKGLATVENLDNDASSLVIGDSVRFHQILMNLLSNAYKFTSQGSVMIKMIAEKHTETHLTITTTVSDTGIGVPEEQRKKLFKPFSQVESNSSRAFQGTGLGLSICKALVEGMMGGEIWLESEAGKGTTVGFRITFRKATEADIDEMEHPVVSAARANSGMYGGAESQVLAPSVRPAYFADISHVPRDQIRICIAEDNPINQKIAVSYVQKLGFGCKAVNNGALAVEALSEASNAGLPFHIVLMDIQMPILSGYDATKQIRLSDDLKIKGVLIIAMTASAIQGDREKCLAAGMNDYLSKPVRPEVLKGILDSYLQPESTTKSNKPLSS